MARLLKTLLGIVLTAGIFIGVAAFVADQNPLGSSSYYSRLCERDGGYLDASGSRQRAACYEMVRRRTDRAEAQERWLGMGLGVVAAALFWFLANILYFRPRRRTNRAAQTEPTEGGQPAPEPGPIARLWPWHAAMLIFFSVGFFVFDNQSRTLQRSAERATESCMLAKALAAGQDPSTYDPPPEAVSECYGPQMEALESSGPYYVGAGAGLVAALVFLAVVLGWRRATGTDPET